MEFLTTLLKSMPGAMGQGLIWGIMAIGVYITYHILDVADLTVDGSLGTGGAVCVLLALNGVNIWIATLCAVFAGMVTGLVTGLLHTRCGIPANWRYTPSICGLWAGAAPSAPKPPWPSG